jgi:DNA-binding MarR family transcriptional regulator
MIRKRPEESLLLRLILVGDRLKRRRDIISQNLGVSTQQWLILLHVARDPNIPFFDNNNHVKDLMPKEIAQTLGTSRPNVTVLVNGLISKGLLSEEADAEDKRRKRLTLTPQGAQLLNDLQQKREELNSALFRDLSPEEMGQLISAIEKIMLQIKF